MSDHQVFISYSTKNIDLVNSIKDALEDRDVKCWMANAYTITNGEDFRQRIVTAIKKAKIILIILSAEALKSKWVALEITEALNQNKKIYTIKIDDAGIDELTAFKLGCSQICDCRENTIAVIESLAINIKKEHDMQLEIDKSKLISEKNILINYIDPLFFGCFVFVNFISLFSILYSFYLAYSGIFEVPCIKLDVGVMSTISMLIHIENLICLIFRNILYKKIKIFAELGSPKALYVMYKYHSNNLYYFKKNKKRAVEYLIKSADLNYYKACFELSTLYEKGKIVSKNMELSLAYLKKGEILLEIKLKNKYIKR